MPRVLAAHSQIKTKRSTPSLNGARKDTISELDIKRITAKVKSRLMENRIPFGSIIIKSQTRIEISEVDEGDRTAVEKILKGKKAGLDIECIEFKTARQNKSAVAITDESCLKLVALYNRALHLPFREDLASEDPLRGANSVFENGLPKCQTYLYRASVSGEFDGVKTTTIPKVVIFTDTDDMTILERAPRAQGIFQNRIAQINNSPSSIPKEEKSKQRTIKKIEGILKVLKIESDKGVSYPFKFKEVRLSKGSLEKNNATFRIEIVTTRGMINKLGETPGPNDPRRIIARDTGFPLEAIVFVIK